MFLGRRFLSSTSSSTASLGDLAGVATFHKLEHRANMLFERMQADPPAGYRHVTEDQVIRADKALRLKIAEETRSQATTVDGAKAVDAAITKSSTHPEVQFHFLPLPTGSSSLSAESRSDTKFPKPHPSKPQQNSAFDKTKGKGKGKGKETSMESNLTKSKRRPTVRFDGKIPHKPICMKYDVGTCTANVRPGKRRQYRYHVSRHKLLPATECPTADAGARRPNEFNSASVH